MPPYWSLGYQLSRYGYADASDMSRTIGSNTAYGIPLDAIYGDIDYMDRQLDFTIGSGFSSLKQYVGEWKSQGVKFVPILDPAISAEEDKDGPTAYFPYTTGLDSDVYCRDADGNLYYGIVWPYKKGTESVDGWDL